MDRDRFGFPIRSILKDVDTQSSPGERTARLIVMACVLCDSTEQTQQELKASKVALNQDRETNDKLSRKLILDRVNYEVLLLRVEQEDLHTQAGFQSPEEFLASEGARWPGDQIGKKMRGYYAATARTIPDEVVASGLAGIKLMGSVGQLDSERCRALLCQVILEGDSATIVNRGVKAARFALQKDRSEQEALERAVEAMAEPPRRPGDLGPDLDKLMKAVMAFAPVLGELIREGLEALTKHSGVLGLLVGELVELAKAKLLALLGMRSGGGPEGRVAPASGKDQRQTPRGGGGRPRAEPSQPVNPGGAEPGSGAGAEPGMEPVRTGAEPGMESVRTGAEPGAEPGMEPVRTGAEPGAEPGQTPVPRAVQTAAPASDGVPQAGEAGGAAQAVVRSTAGSAPGEHDQRQYPRGTETGDEAMDLQPDPGADRSDGAETDDDDGEEAAPDYHVPIVRAVMAALSAPEQEALGKLMCDIVRGAPVESYADTLFEMWERCGLEAAGVDGEHFDFFMNQLCGPDWTLRGQHALALLIAAEPPDWAWQMHVLSERALTPELRSQVLDICDRVPPVQVEAPGEGPEAEARRTALIALAVFERIEAQIPEAAYAVQRLLAREAAACFLAMCEIAGPPPLVGGACMQLV